MKLQTYLAHSGLTIPAFAARLGVKDSTVLRWAKGANKPRAHHVAAVVRATDGQVTVADLRPDLVNVLDDSMPRVGTGARSRAPGIVHAAGSGQAAISVLRVQLARIEAKLDRLLGPGAGSSQG